MKQYMKQDEPKHKPGTQVTTAHSHLMFLSSLMMTVCNTEYASVPLVYRTVTFEGYINSFTSLIYKMCDVFIIKLCK